MFLTQIFICLTTTSRGPVSLFVFVHWFILYFAVQSVVRMLRQGRCFAQWSVVPWGSYLVDLIVTWWRPWKRVSAQTGTPVPSCWFAAWGVCKIWYVKFSHWQCRNQKKVKLCTREKPKDYWSWSTKVQQYKAGIECLNGCLLVSNKFIF